MNNLRSKIMKLQTARRNRLVAFQVKDVEGNWRLCGLKENIDRQLANLENASTDIDMLIHFQII